MTQVIFATKNKGKIREITELLKDMPLEILSMEEAGLSMEIEENGTTFEENALIKARAVCKASGCYALADDSGLAVDYLDGAPGVYSARYMGEETPYDIKNQKIISLLEKAKGKERRAQFVSVIAFVTPQGEEMTTRGVIEGEIGYESKGENGFGYDPIFYVPEYDMTTAQMSLELKNKISHRGKALGAMKEKLDAYFKMK
ncbi:MAG: XTP/dITP diphosphatase [Clostridiales bacterium]|nr:XTP/dITP diphosphatase [Clostridiales bacterium]